MSSVEAALFAATAQARERIRAQAARSLGAARQEVPGRHGPRGTNELARRARATTFSWPQTCKRATGGYSLGAKNEEGEFRRFRAQSVLAARSSRRAPVVHVPRARERRAATRAPSASSVDVVACLPRRLQPEPPLRVISHATFARVLRHALGEQA